VTGDRPSTERAPARPPIPLTVDGRSVEVPDDGSSLLAVLRDHLGLRSAKDGCSPQGQCGCCTVLVDGQPRVACVTPARRVRGRSVTTLDGLPDDERHAWGDAFCATGASQCGFCTPGIIVRLSALAAKGVETDDVPAVEQALLAHLCRCTGWRTILDAWSAHGATQPGTPVSVSGGVPTAERDLAAAERRATIEGRTPQRVAPDVALGHGGFADDGAPADALVAVPDPAGGWAVGETLADARAAAGKVQGRRTTAEIRHPLDVPDGDWAATLRTTWVEPAYLETDASWCAPGGEPATPLGNGGAFGGKVLSVAAPAARALADEHGRPVRVVLAREDAVRLGPKRPPVAGGMRSDGTGELRIAVGRGAGVGGPLQEPGEGAGGPAPERQAPTSAAGPAAGRDAAGGTPTGGAPAVEDPDTVVDDIRAAVAAVAPGLSVEPVAVPGPPTSADPRGAGWAEALVLAAVAGVTVPDDGGSPGVLAVDVGRASPAGTGQDDGGGRAGVSVRSPDGAVATAEVGLGAEPRVAVDVSCGVVLDEIVLRSYCIGAAHMALGWVTSEGLAVDETGEVHDLTIRSFGVLRAIDTPPIDVTIDTAAGGGPVNGSDAVFAAVAAAAWLAQGAPPAWPTGVRPR
jgi:xanthine dehydrogenase small subunit